jgi:hypothetical protein
MTGGQTSHLTVHYSDGESTYTAVYAVNKDIVHKLNWKKALCFFLGRKEPTGRALQEWLETKGCKLDSADGPAFVRHHPGGFRVEVHYRDGKKYREDGPARVVRFSDGSTVEDRYRNATPELRDYMYNFWGLSPTVPDVTPQRPTPKADVPSGLGPA